MAPTWAIHQARPRRRRGAGRADDAVAEAATEQAGGKRGETGQERARGDHEAGPQHRLVPDARQEQDAAEHEGAEAEKKIVELRSANATAR